MLRLAGISVRWALAKVSLPMSAIDSSGKLWRLSFLLTVYFLVIEYTGFVFSRKGLKFKDQKKFIKTNKLLCAGFGCGAFFLLAIPFLQLFSIPMGVVGATLLCHENRAPSSQQLSQT